MAVLKINMTTFCVIKEKREELVWPWARGRSSILHIRTHVCCTREVYLHFTLTICKSVFELSPVHYYTCTLYVIHWLLLYVMCNHVPTSPEKKKERKKKPEKVGSTCI